MPTVFVLVLIVQLTCKFSSFEIKVAVPHISMFLSLHRTRECHQTDKLHRETRRGFLLFGREESGYYWE